MVTGWMGRLLPLLALLLIVLAPRLAAADPRTAYLVDQLKSNDDYRVRTQAALALGASADDGAVQPLCDALGADSNVSVRVASAAALGKLGKSAGLPCLKAAEPKESAPAAKSQIQKSIATLAGGGSGAPAGVGPDTKYYVAIQVTSKSGRDVDSVVRGAMQAKLQAKKGYAVAPKSETVSQGRDIVKGKGLKGYFLIATVEAPVYEGGNLTQKVRVSLWTYPDKALQAEVAPWRTQTGTSKGDTESENVLMKMCVEEAVDNIQKIVASM